jgi:hypothetical protein
MSIKLSSIWQFTHRNNPVRELPYADEPLGLALDSYDSLGHYCPKDSGKPIDANRRFARWPEFRRARRFATDGDGVFKQPFGRFDATPQQVNSSSPRAPSPTMHPLSPTRERSEANILTRISHPRFVCLARS